MESAKRAIRPSIAIKKIVAKKPIKSTIYKTEVNNNCAKVFKNNEECFTLDFDDEGTPFCCGLRELGNFTIDEDFDDDYCSHLQKVKVIRELFKYLYDRYTKENDCITLIFTLIDNNESSLIRSALRGSKLFKKVKSFTNINTNNINDVYMSTN